MKLKSSLSGQGTGAPLRVVAKHLAPCALACAACGAPKIVSAKRLIAKNPVNKVLRNIMIELSIPKLSIKAKFDII